MAKPTKYLFIARFGNGMYKDTVRVFTNKNTAREFLCRSFEENQKRVNSYQHSSLEWRKQWESFDFFLRMIGYKYYIGTLDSMDLEKSGGPKNIPSNKFFSWLMDDSPL